MTWDKGKVPLSKLKKFYGKSGFTPTTKDRGTQAMIWAAEPKS